MGALFRVLLLIGFVAKFWWLIVLVLAAIVAGAMLWLRRRRRLEAAGRRRREQAALVARADQQHGWVLEGDDRGVYGDYPPSQ